VKLAGGREQGAGSREQGLRAINNRK